MRTELTPERFILNGRSMLGFAHSEILEICGNDPAVRGSLGGRVRDDTARLHATALFYDGYSATQAALELATRRTTSPSYGAT